MSIPPHVSARRTSSAGTGLFTLQPIDAGELVFKVERPLITVLDSSRLKEYCDWCLLKGHVDGEEDDEEQGLKLKACTGCRIVRYCSKTCQTSSWRHAHKLTCPIYKRLSPKILPNTVRAILELLLRRSTKSIKDTEWETFLELESHVNDFHTLREKNEDGLTTWQTIELMSQAATLYSGTKEPLPFVQQLTARILTNTHTLTTPHLDPLGLSLSLPSSHLNHSCTPNTCITFSGPHLSLRALTPIATDTELTISYIDTTLPAPLRRAELQSRYFFTCTCTTCTAPSPSEYPERAIEEINSLLATAKTTSDHALLARALTILDSRPLHTYPSPTVRHQYMLSALSTQNWKLALRLAIQIHDDIDPVLFPQRWHPVRVVHAWVLLRLVVQVAEVGVVEEEVKWHFVIWRLWKEVNGVVGRSHGEDSGFAAEVGGFGERVGEGLERFEGSEGVERAGRLMGEEWERLKGLV